MSLSEPPPEPCALLFAIVLVLVCCAVVLVGLHATDARHNGGLRRRVAADGMSPAVERATAGVLLLLLLTAVALMCVLLVWAREGQCGL